MSENEDRVHSLALTPSWSVATVLMAFVSVSLIVERLIHRLSAWLEKTNRKPLSEALDKMKEELMLLGFISLLLTATSTTISRICISSKFYDGNLIPCTKTDAEETEAENAGKERRLLMVSVSHKSFRKLSEVLNQNTCKEGYEPFVSYEGLEQLHRFIFVMAITHISYSCLTMLLAIVKVHTWRKWEDEAHADRQNAFPEILRDTAVGRHSSLVMFHPLARNKLIVWLTCFFRQFASSVGRADYLALRTGFIMNHKLKPTFDFHNYMVRSMEEDFQRVVGVSAPLWGFVVAFMLFNVNGLYLYLWMALIPISLILIVGTKLQHIMATLVWENAGINGLFSGTKLKPQDDLFWFKKPRIFLSLIHFALFQIAFELASFFWYWWQFGYDSCFIKNHYFVYIRLIMGFAGQFLCSYSTLPLYALVTQIGTNYKAALIPQRITDTLHGWKKVAKKKRQLGILHDDSTTHTDTSTVISLEDDEHWVYKSPNSVMANSPTVAQESAASLGSRPLWSYISVSPEKDEYHRYQRPNPEAEIPHVSIVTDSPRTPSESNSIHSLGPSTSHSPVNNTGLQQGTSKSPFSPAKRSSVNENFDGSAL